MQLEMSPSTHGFDELNQYMRTTQHVISATAAAVVVIQNGHIVNEWYSGYHGSSSSSRPVDAKSRFNVASVRKTYLGAAISLAIYEGKINSIDDPVTDYITDCAPDILSHTTIRHLLTHTHGLQGHSKRIFPPGTEWKYNNAGVNLLIQMVKNLFGRPLAQVMQERFFGPYGFTKTGWIQEELEELVWLHEAYSNDQGSEGNLFASTRELAYWGYLHLTQGLYKGKQIMPSAVFDTCSTIATPVALDPAMPRNGFFWWVQDAPRPLSELGTQLPEGSYQSLGLYGNAILVIPVYQIVAVRMLNQTEPNPPTYDYIQGIQTFGNLVGQYGAANNQKPS
ncbi:CubicO group peptidase, beta-lactamase class C family [Paenibacillus sp. 1_12]|uniref:serine hydrolase domain-containing protein n=1 Tax=Paenibacillus sp. 1_12 TaxID=1566278 RepID=UPI0008E8B99C|nr:serine hydrolase domain-containing protein [Paenibacillus sp. 1_12]SFL76648.1 CubicO group peptidase, beta-lactamase class C family [Paenibacillus sp. 1_12]